MKRYIWIGLLILIVVLLIGGTGYYFLRGGFSKEEVEGGFKLNPSFLKVAVIENGSAISIIKIKNLDPHVESCDIKVGEIGDLVSLNETSINLVPNEEYPIELFFNAQNKTPGVYVGVLKISSQRKTQVMPIILEIQSEIVVFDSNLNIYPQGGTVIPGQRISADVKIFDLAGIGRHNIELLYSIKNFDGRIIISSTEDLVVDGRLDYSKSWDLPKDLRLGDYVLAVVVKYVDSVGTKSIGTSSMFFRVIGEDEFTSGEKDLSDKTLFYILLIFSFFFLIFLGLFVYSLFYKDKLLIELQKQYKGELRRQRELINGKMSRDYSKLKTAAEKEAYKKEVEKIKGERLKALNEIQKKRVVKFKKIKKQGKKGLLKKQVEKWKQRGYEDDYLETKYKFPKVEEIRRKLGRQLGALEEAKEEGFVSQKSYEKGKERVRRANRKLK